MDCGIFLPTETSDLWRKPDLRSSGSYYFNLVGAKRAATTEGDTHLTIRSGIWRNIYAASYTGNVLGDVYLTMTGGTVTAVVQTSYSGLTTGTVTMDLSGCEIQGNIFGGNTDSNHLIGNTTIILGPGASVQSVYGGSGTRAMSRGLPL